jgi:hypothetical protein
MDPIAKLREVFSAIMRAYIHLPPLASLLSLRLSQNQPNRAVFVKPGPNKKSPDIGLFVEGQLQ